MLICTDYSSLNYTETKDITKKILEEWLESNVMLSLAIKRDDNSAALLLCITIKYGVVFVSDFTFDRNDNIKLKVCAAFIKCERTANMILKSFDIYDMVFVDRMIWDDREYIIPPYPNQPFKCKTIRSVASYIRKTYDTLIFN